jgi:hypothetical protein
MSLRYRATAAEDGDANGNEKKEQAPETDISETHNEFCARQIA